MDCNFYAGKMFWRFFRLQNGGVTFMRGRLLREQTRYIYELLIATFFKCVFLMMLFSFACVHNTLSVSFTHFYLYCVVGNILEKKKKSRYSPDIRNLLILYFPTKKNKTFVWFHKHIFKIHFQKSSLLSQAKLNYPNNSPWLINGSNAGMV